MKLLMLFFGMFFSVLIFNQPRVFTEKFTEIEHKIKVQHKGNKKSAIETVLVEIKNKKGATIAFYTDVESVICAEQVCKVVAVRLFWDEMGNYKKYELADNILLEKYDGKPFEKNDYLKLDVILAKKNSPFKNLEIEEILNTVVSYDDGTEPDATSGATLIQIDENETVPGAALTCFTLWHWANGSIIQQIRDITGSGFQQENFKVYLKSKELNKQLFALEQLTVQKVFSTGFGDLVQEQVIQNSELFKLGLHYFENAPAEIYFNAIEGMYAKLDEKLTLEVLNSLLKSKNNPTKAFFESIGASILASKSYQEITLFYRLLEKNAIVSTKINTESLALLHEDIVISRRVFWFLKSQQLPDEQAQIVHAFYTKHKDNLE